ncbi:MAG: hypothetical protein ACRDTE_29125 [Pseudonocardiaceae bacterium]
MGEHHGGHGARASSRTGACRIGHHYIDLTRAWVLHGDRAKALDALTTARELTPQLAR